MQFFKTQKVKTTSLTPHPRNYRKHPEDQLQHICESIEAHGFYRNIVIAKDNVILAGHGVVEASLKLGIEQVPVIKLPVTHDDVRALKVLAGDNEISNLADVDDRELTNMLKEIMEVDVSGLLGTGFSEELLANLLMVTRSAAEIASKDDAAEYLGLPDYQEEEPIHKMIMSFRTVEDRAEFCEKFGITVKRKEKGTWSAWYPHREDYDLASVRFDVDEQPA